jgi:hypothetical protein
MGKSASCFIVLVLLSMSDSKTDYFHVQEAVVREMLSLHSSGYTTVRVVTVELHTTPSIDSFGRCASLYLPKMKIGVLVDRKIEMDRANSF